MKNIMQFISKEKLNLEKVREVAQLLYLNQNRVRPIKLKIRKGAEAEVAHLNQKEEQQEVKRLKHHRHSQIAKKSHKKSQHRNQNLKHNHRLLLRHHLLKVKRKMKSLNPINIHNKEVKQKQLDLLWQHNRMTLRTINLSNLLYNRAQVVNKRMIYLQTIMPVSRRKELERRERMMKIQIICYWKIKIIGEEYKK